MGPEARWPDGTPVQNPFKPGSFRWSLVAQWGYWEDDTVRQMAEVMSMQPQNVRKAILEVRRKTKWLPPVRRGEMGRPPKVEYQA